MPVLCRALIVALALLAPPATAGSPIEAVPEGADIPPEQWQALASGRTLTYRMPDGSLFAREYYHPGGNQVTLQFADGTCMDGVWDYTAPRYCFYWEHADFVCFRHLRRGRVVLVVQQTAEGADTNLIQWMTEVSDAAPACGPPLVG